MSKFQSPLNQKAEPKTEWTGDLVPRNAYWEVIVHATRRQMDTHCRAEAPKRNTTNTVRRARNAANKRFRREIQEALSSDSSADEIPQQDEEPVPWGDEGHFAYDARGENVLLAALSNAQTKYEDKVFEKTVKEYEVISHDEYASGLGYVADIDDFEVIDHHSV
ncbi:hypothetical protein PISL3812_05658 [Talaromyces islandicus]|uniref:Uncharacterized protein n=1 Tax=Talaromyces islandicus TaxID=28573 RepID=A0A0U1LZ70_TALIS|nr:hypothetical protein PISL3812_05658 [Talaromyces islandicus]